LKATAINSPSYKEFFPREQSNKWKWITLVHISNAKKKSAEIRCQLFPTTNETAAKYKREAYVIEQLVRDYYRKRIEINQLSDYFRNKEWSRLIPFINEVIFQLKNSRYPIGIEELIRATLITLETGEEDVFSRDVTETLNTYFKDIKALFNIEKSEDSLDRAQRCKELIQLAEELTGIAKKEDLVPLKESQLVKVDDFHGRPVYTIRE
jgi:hypothetical protein